MNPNLVEYIRHPELLDSNTLFTLRTLTERYPYHQTARLLYLCNLYKLRDPSFGEELSRTALYVADRKALYSFIEASNMHNQSAANEDEPKGDRTKTLITQFLSNLPEIGRAHV